MWDRNKGVIKTVAPFAAGLIPGAGPLIAAGLGAAMGGLDRPGKGGIGLDLGGAVKGGISGYGAGKTSAGLKKMFTGQMAKRAAAKGAQGLAEATQAMQKGLPVIPDVMGGMGSAASAAPSALPGAAGGFDAGSYLANDLASQAPSRAMQLGKGVPTVNPAGSRVMNAAKKTGGFLERNQQALGGAAKGIAGVMGSRAEGEAAAGNLALAQGRFDYEKQRDTLDQEKRRRLAQMMGQMFVPQMANVSPSAMNMQDYMDSTGSNIPPEGFGPGMMEYINSGRGPTRPSGPNPELMEYVNSRRGPVRPSGPNPELMEYVNSRRGPVRPSGPNPEFMQYINNRR
jgi:hypothetical protein